MGRQLRVLAGLGTVIWGIGLKKVWNERLSRVSTIHGETHGGKGGDRYLLGRWVRKQNTASVKWLAEQLGIKTRGGMSHGIYLIGKRLEKDRGMTKKWKILEKIR